MTIGAVGQKAPPRAQHVEEKPQVAKAGGVKGPGLDESPEDLELQMAMLQDQQMRRELGLPNAGQTGGVSKPQPGASYNPAKMFQVP